MTRVIDVDGDWAALGGATPIGRLLVDRVRGKENFGFSYDDEWLRSSTCRTLDPELQSTAQKFGNPHHTFLTKRFDRETTGGVRQRRHFASAMTMLGYRDGDNPSVVPKLVEP